MFAGFRLKTETWLQPEPVLVTTARLLTSSMATPPGAAGVPFGEVVDTLQGAKGSHGADRLGSGAQGDFRRRAKVRRSADRRAVDRRSLHTFDVDGLNVAKPKTGQRAAAR